jgi:hypothetical protein
VQYKKASGSIFFGSIKMLGCDCYAAQHLLLNP